MQDSTELMKLDGLVVREAKIDDCEFLLALEQELIDSERPYNPSLKENGAYYYDMEKLILDQNSKLLVGELDSFIIATGYIQVRRSKPSLEHGEHGYLGFMYVAEEYRGLGLNRLIMEHLVDWGKARGLTNFYLDVYAENRSAVRAYEKFGFEPSLLEMKLNVQN